jgi:hypothetical protein
MLHYQKDVHMNALTKILSGLALATASLYAAAAPISVTDTMVLNLPVTDTAPNSFIIDLTDNGSGYVAGAGSVTSAMLHLVLSDPLASNEQYSIFFGSNPTAAVAANNIVNSGTQTIDIALDAVALADLSLDGKLTVILMAALQGRNDETANYLAVSSTLDANPGAGSGAASIPEPASLGLMGITLAGLAATRRRKQK